MIKINDIIQHLENIAPPAYQENYDNSGFVTGNAADEVKGIIITLDTTEAVIEEAISENCNLVIAHHPIIFKGLKKLTGKNYVERTIIKAIKHDIAIYAIHTNLDSINHGVNKKFGEKLGLEKLRILAPSTNTLSKLTAFVPQENTDHVLDALYKAGAGQIGNYNDCSFRMEGTGTFTPNEFADPLIGKIHQREEVAENRIEVIFPSHLQSKIIVTIKEAHPYEEVAYYLQSLDNYNQEVGAGMIGELKNPMSEEDFLLYLKERMQLKMLRHTQLSGEPIKEVAFCGGSGSFLIHHAIRSGADAYISADIKYHDFFEADNKLLIADIGHYESEVYTKELIYELLYKKFTNIALNLSKVDTNPISYL